MILSISILKTCDPASDWSLVVNSYVYSLVACMVAYDSM